VPYGYHKVAAFDALGEPINGLREIYLDRAAIVRRCHQDFDAGKTTFEICATLNAEGIPSHVRVHGPPDSTPRTVADSVAPPIQCSRNHAMEMIYAQKEERKHPDCEGKIKARGANGPRLRRK